MKSYRTALIKGAQPGDDKYFGDINTQGIVEVVLYADTNCGDYTSKFAPTLRSAKLFDTCKNIWEFVKTQIPYVLDKTGYQWIKSPGRLWNEKAGDCKSFSVFIASCLKNLNIPYGYRFTSYDRNDPTPTHVYIYVPLTKGEIILDAVWTGPFNTEKPYAFKKDYPMAKTHYLGADDRKHTPGVLKITTPIEDLTDGELSLLLAKQRLEIKKMNAGIGGIGNYDEAIKTLDHCIRNIGNPDLIIGIGEALEEGYSLEEAISGLGASAKKTAKKEAKAQKKKETGKTAAGRLLQKVGKGIKAGAKAVVKVVTAPMRLVAKGAMEIYLPKAAPFFLYLFAGSPDSLPDMMKRKRAKAEKFKNFVVKGLGMKDEHFMQIISNNLEKRYGKPPAQYIAEKLKTRVSGIGNPKARERAYLAGIGGDSVDQKRAARKAAQSAKKVFQPNAIPNYNTTVKSPISQDSANSSKGAFQALKAKAPDFTALNNQVEFNRQRGLEQLTAKKEKKKESMDKLLDIGEKAASGNLISAAIGAISWLISKITSLFGGKEKMDPITADDFPDVERDAANAFEYKDLTQDYSKLDNEQKEQAKETVAEAIARGLENTKLQEFISTKLPFLDTSQKKEMYQEAEEGAEALDHSEGQDLAKDIEKGSGSGSGSGSEGNNNTALIALAAVAVIALAK